MQLQDSDQQKQQLVNEKSQMASELKSLSRDLSKLDQFKKSIMQSIHDEEPVPSLRYRGGASAAYDTSPPTNTYEPTPAAPRAYSPPQPSPPLPAAPAGGSSYKALSSAASSPPVAAAAPAEGGSAHLDGKDFFRQANLRLTKEQFRQARAEHAEHARPPWCTAIGDPCLTTAHRLLRRPRRAVPLEHQAPQRPRADARGHAAARARDLRRRERRPLPVVQEPARQARSDVIHAALASSRKARGASTPHARRVGRALSHRVDVGRDNGAEGNAQ